MKKFTTFLTAFTASTAMLGIAPVLAEESEAGLPQFNPALFPEQLFWLAISFTALYLLMHFVALPGVERAQGNRKNVIGAEIAAAKTANEQAKTLSAQADRALAESRAKAQATITDIKTAASKTAGEQQAVQAKQIAERMRAAEAAIATARDAALKEIDGTASDMASAIVEQVSGKVRA